MMPVITLDNSPTLFVPRLNEHYHSVNGAVAESLHVFIKNGFEYVRSRKKTGNCQAPMTILEVGMGTGLNVCLTMKHAGDAEISYTALEPFPLDESVWKKLNYDAWVDRKVFEEVHECEWNVSRRMTYAFKKLKTTIQNFQPADHQITEKFDLIYFDAFAPSVQPELWTEDIFSKLFRMANEGGALVTYCAKGSVKRALKSSGFIVESLPGAPGKREMVRATVMG